MQALLGELITIVCDHRNPGAPQLNCRDSRPIASPRPYITQPPPLPYPSSREPSHHQTVDGKRVRDRRCGSSSSAWYWDGQRLRGPVHGVFRLGDSACEWLIADRSSPSPPCRRTPWGRRREVLPPLFPIGGVRTVAGSRWCRQIALESVRGEKYGLGGRIRSPPPRLRPRRGSLPSRHLYLR